jgi:hypothetical protein
VPVGNEVEALVFVLETHPVLQDPEVMAKVEFPRRSDAGYDAILVHTIPSLIS